MFPKSLSTQFADGLAATPRHPTPSCDSLRNAEFQMWDWVGK